MKVCFLIPFLFFIIACQSNDQKQVPVKIQKQAFDYAIVEDDYAEILDAIIAYNSISNEVAKTNKRMAYILTNGSSRTRYIMPTTKTLCLTV